MDFLFSGFIEFKNVNGDPAYIEASKIIMIEQSHFDENSCAVALDDKTMMIPMSAAEMRRKVSEIRARGRKTLRDLLK